MDQELIVQLKQMIQRSAYESVSPYEFVDLYLKMQLIQEIKQLRMELSEGQYTINETLWRIVGGMR